MADDVSHEEVRENISGETVDRGVIVGRMGHSSLAVVGRLRVAGMIRRMVVRVAMTQGRMMVG